MIMGTCVQCKRPAVVHPSYTKSIYCKHHFRELIEKRVRKDIRLHQALQVKQVYAIEESSSRAELLRDLLKSIYKGRLVIAEKADNRLSTEVLEEYVSDLFVKFLEGKEMEEPLHQPLRTVSSEDVSALMGMTDECRGHPLLMKLAKNQPSSFFALLKSLEYIKK